MAIGIAHTPSLRAIPEQVSFEEASCIEGVEGNTET
jgi:hypothetical protein